MFTLLTDECSGFSPSQYPASFDQLPEVLSSCNTAIDLRSECNKFHEQCTPGKNGNAQASHEKHDHFVGVMKEWRFMLRLLRRMSRTALPPPRSLPERDSRLEEEREIVDGNAFNALSLADDDDDNRTYESDSDSKYEDEDGSFYDDDDDDSFYEYFGDSDYDDDGDDDSFYEHPHDSDFEDDDESDYEDGESDEDFIYGMHLLEETLDDFDDIVFVLRCFIMDLDNIMGTVAAKWKQVYDEEANYLEATVVSLLALQRVQKKVQQLQVQLPEIKTFEDLVTGLMQRDVEAGVPYADSFGGESTSDIAEQMVDLYLYATFRTAYRCGSLVQTMQNVVLYVRSFKTAIPEGASMMLRTGYFGKPFDEREAQIFGDADFARRFVCEHLPLIYNDFLLLGDFFKRTPSGVEFLLFGQLFDEFRFFFESKEKTSSIPLVFLICMWYHSVQILQGSVRLSRFTAMTRSTITRLRGSLERCEKRDKEEKHKHFFEVSLVRLRFLEEHSDLYRNHPFMAGVVSLDVAVNVSLFVGKMTIPMSKVVHRAMHLYNAIITNVRKCAPAAVMEYLLEVHSGSYFHSSRPTSKLLEAFDMTCPGMQERSLSKLYRVLVDQDYSQLVGPELSRFEDKATYVCDLWEKEFVDTKLLAFDFISLQEALTPVIDDMSKLIPHRLKSPDDCFVLMIGLFDKQVELPFRAPAMKVFMDGLRKLKLSSFDLILRVCGTIHSIMYGRIQPSEPSSAETLDESSDDHDKQLSCILDLFKNSDETLSSAEVEHVFSTAREYPGIMGMADTSASDPEKLITGIVHHAAAGPRANTMLLERLLQIDTPNQFPKGDKLVHPIHACAAYGKLENLKLLLGAKNYAIRDMQCAAYGNTPLHYAAKNGRIEIVLYLTLLNVDPHIRNKKKKMAAQLAASNDIKEVMRVSDDLFSHGRSVLEARTDAMSQADQRLWNAAAEIRSDRVRRTLNRRRQKKEAVRPVTLDDELRADRAAEELLALVAKEDEAKAKKKKNGKKKKKGKR